MGKLWLHLIILVLVVEEQEISWVFLLLVSFVLNLGSNYEHQKEVLMLF